MPWLTLIRLKFQAKISLACIYASDQIDAFETTDYKHHVLPFLFQETPVKARIEARIIIDDIRCGLEEFVKDFVCNEPDIERNLIIQALCEFTVAAGVLVLGQENLVQLLWKAVKDLEPQLEMRIAKTYNENEKRAVVRRAS